MKAVTTRILDWSALDESARDRALARAPSVVSQELRDAVTGIINKVRSEGDAALETFSRRFDGRVPDNWKVSKLAVSDASGKVNSDLLQSLRAAADRIEEFHRACKPEPVSVQTTEGVTCETVYRPIRRVGLYVPAGSAPLISTVLMLGIPARLAGCAEVILCTPPGEAEIDPALLAAADIAGITNIYQVGGAQAIAAMAYGTATIPACDKLYGPGNAWVTEAKRQVAQDPKGAAQDLPAGPSEVLVIADSAANPEFVAADLLAQAEHGPDSQSILLSPDEQLLQAVAERLPIMAEALPRKDILAESLAWCRLILTADLDECVAISNRYAPEHLIINTASSRLLLDQVEAAGSVFLGPWTPESLGDYCSGTNHVLPTYGWARNCNGLSTVDFMQRITVQQATQEGLQRIGPDAQHMAAAEGLDAHRLAVSLRLEQLQGREQQP